MAASSSHHPCETSHFVRTSTRNSDISIKFGTIYNRKAAKSLHARSRKYAGDRSTLTGVKPTAMTMRVCVSVDAWMLHFLLITVCHHGSLGGGWPRKIKHSDVITPTGEWLVHPTARFFFFSARRNGGRFMIRKHAAWSCGIIWLRVAKQRMEMQTVHKPLRHHKITKRIQWRAAEQALRNMKGRKKH